MSNPTWPTTLPAPLADNNTSYQPVSNALRTNMEAGVAKVRRRFTAVARPFNCSVNCTTAQMVTLIDFYQNVVLDVLPFDWLDFRTNATATYRFVQRPQESYIQGSLGRWVVAMQLELLP